jgi:hypothetical protein
MKIKFTLTNIFKFFEVENYFFLLKIQIKKIIINEYNLKLSYKLNISGKSQLRIPKIIFLKRSF